MKTLLKLSFIFTLFITLSCDKKLEIEPANIHGSWTNYQEFNNYFEGMRFMENGEFFFVERFGYEKDLYEKNMNGAKFTFKLENQVVSIYRTEDNAPVLVRSFKIKSLTKGRLIEEEGNYVWKREY